MNELKYESKECDLGDILSQFIPSKAFNIPLYQRLYVWQDEQVQTLIDDLLSAYNFNCNKDYYLGNVICVRKKSSKKEEWDLVDGQQRFTSLWLLLKALGEEHYHIGFESNDISLSDVVNQCNSNTKLNNENVQADVNRLTNAYNIFKKAIENIDQPKPQITFKEFLKNHVKLVITKAPSYIDLNKLFEVINGRGVQLKQHELLKALLLNTINKKDKNNSKAYAAVWDVCADMNSLFERNIKEYLNNTWKEHDFDLSFEKFVSALNKEEELGDTKNDSIDLFNIIKPIHGEEVTEKKEGNTSTQQDDDPDYFSENKYESIISFEYFLLYTLMGLPSEKLKNKDKDKDKTKDNKVAFKDKNLIEIFKNNIDIENFDVVECFFKDLYQNRQVFDKYVIKSVNKRNGDSDSNRHEIINVKLNNQQQCDVTTKTQSEYKSLSLLQSMLSHAHSRQAQEWLVPFLSFAKNSSNTIDGTTLLCQLMSIDNHLYSNINANGTRQQDNTILSSAVALSKPNHTFIVPDEKNIQKYLAHSPDNGTNFKHYWFYKLDWIIYYLQQEKKPELVPNEDKEKYFSSFIFTARNSVEHISPQELKDHDNDSVQDHKPKMLHQFANLALLSRSHNSTLSNDTFSSKKEWFNSSSTSIANLKLAEVFSHDTWAISNNGSKSGIEKHQEFCREVISGYFTKLIAIK